MDYKGLGCNDVGFKGFDEFLGFIFRVYFRVYFWGLFLGFIFRVHF
jgi:hypothetical protein